MDKHSLVYLNGDYIALNQAKISVLDRGFLFADSVYEVIPVYNGIPFSLKAHLERLFNSLKAINLQLTKNHAQLTEIIEQLIQQNKGVKSFYIQVSRGADSKRRHAIVPNLIPTLFVMPLFHRYKVDNSGIKLVTLEDTRWAHCFIKSTALLPNVLLTDEAAKAGAHEALLYKNGFITEGASSNVIFVKNKKLYSPNDTANILPGITKQIVAKIAKNKHIPFIELPIPLAMLTDADEVWITSATREIAPVTQINDIMVGEGQPGKLWQLFSKAYQQIIADEIPNANRSQTSAL